ncbi:aegerolysin type hemolysin [Lyophyllum atratum]|nr:aegerolysin type hemolysin [Lyophyllum atratum]
MGESQWFQPTVRNRLSQAIVLANFSIQYGKFYDINDPYTETNSAQGTKITSKGDHEFGHCGRENSPTGTEGSFEVHLSDTGEKIAKIYWDCPYTGSNKLTKHDLKAGYDISFDGFSVPSGPLGKGTISVRED